MPFLRFTEIFVCRCEKTQHPKDKYNKPNIVCKGGFSSFEEADKETLALNYDSTMLQRFRFFPMFVKNWLNTRDFIKIFRSY